MRIANKTRATGVALAMAAAIVGLPALAAAEDMLPMDAGKAQIERAFGAESGNFAPKSFDLPPGVHTQRLGPGQPGGVPVPGPSRAIGVPGIQFAFGSAHLTDASQSLVDMIAAALLKRDWFVTVVGHTDAYGDPESNLVLSQQRALTVAYYLVNVSGLPQSRVAYAGVGSAQPWDPNDPYAPQNRRVTFVLQRD
jgi:outer membrane protein OmpA-like peptidoglycan-associated protein